MQVYHDFYGYSDPDQRFLIRIRILANDTDPTGSETLDPDLDLDLDVQENDAYNLKVAEHRKLRLEREREAMKERIAQEVLEAEQVGTWSFQSSKFCKCNAYLFCH